MAATKKTIAAVDSESLPTLHPVVIPTNAPNPQSLTSAAQQFFTISTREQYESSGLTLGDIKTAQTYFHNLFDKSIDAWNKGHKHELAMRNQFTGPLDKLEAKIKSAQAAYNLAEIQRQRMIADRNARIMREEAEREARETAANLREFGTPDAIEDAERLEEKIESGTLEVSAPPPMILTVPKSGTGSSGRLVQTVVVCDVDKLGRSYMVPDLELLNSLFTSFGPDGWKEFESLVGVGSVRLEYSIIMSQRQRSMTK